MRRCLDAVLVTVFFWKMEDANDLPSAYQSSGRESNLQRSALAYQSSGIKAQCVLTWRGRGRGRGCSRAIDIALGDGRGRGLDALRWRCGFGLHVG